VSTVIRKKRGGGASRRGHDRERDVKDLLQERGWIVIRAAGSMGDVDLVAVGKGLLWHPSEPRPGVRLQLDVVTVLLIESKSTIGPYSHFGPKQRAELLWAAARCGAEPWLSWWPAHGDLRWIPGADWPKPRKGAVAHNT
jgi:hypothetical protein